MRLRNKLSERVQTEWVFPETLRRTTAELEEELNRGHQQTIRVKTHRNRVTMISIQGDAQGFVTCRMHEAFLAAPEEVTQSLRSFLATRRKADWAPVAEFAQTIDPAPPKQLAVKTTGRVYDLEYLRDEVNADWFDGLLDVRITWGRNPKRSERSRHSSIHFGSYTKSMNLIRIHPRLDSDDVPEEFVRFVIYHEMLHIKIPPRRDNGRWVFHSPEFRKAERLYPHFIEMEQTASRILGSL